MTGVAPGTYYVLAYRNDNVNVEAKNAPGVYSQYVETVPRIDLTDWYYGPAGPSYPPRPR